jgi:hypothetical protein
VATAASAATLIFGDENIGRRLVGPQRRTLPRLLLVDGPLPLLLLTVRFL